MIIFIKNKQQSSPMTKKKKDWKIHFFIIATSFNENLMA